MIMKDFKNSIVSHDDVNCSFKDMLIIGAEFVAAMLCVPAVIAFSALIVVMVK